MKYLFLLFITSSNFALASGSGEGHGLDQHQIQTIIYQTINVTILFAGLFYFLKNPIKNFFKEKKEVFIAAAEKAQAIKVAAESEHMDIKVRLTKLESTADESLSKAKIEAAELKKQLISEANITSKRIKDEAAATARLEIEKAKKKLREQLILDSADVVQNQLKTAISNDDHKRLQSDFVNNIGAVNP